MFTNGEDVPSKTSFRQEGGRKGRMEARKRAGAILWRRGGEAPVGGADGEAPVGGRGATRCRVRAPGSRDGRREALAVLGHGSRKEGC